MSNVLMHPVTEFTTALQAPLGTKVERGNGTTFRYVQFVDAITYVAGMACTWDDRNGWKVTNDISSAEDADLLAGVVHGVPTENQYGYIQTLGEHSAVKKVGGDDTIAAGALLKAHSSTDGVLATYAFSAASTWSSSDNALVVTALQTMTGYAIASGASNDTDDTVPVVLYCE